MATFSEKRGGEYLRKGKTPGAADLIGKEKTLIVFESQTSLGKSSRGKRNSYSKSTGEEK